MTLMLLLILLTFSYSNANDVIFNADTRLGRLFDGIGAISGGGATTKLLPAYNENVIDTILNYLFKPGFAASLQILKVEIGGDSQSTEGTEASHMHTASDLNCNRGYEGWLISRVKKINPNIRIHALPWSFPGWIGANQNPYQKPELLANYIVKWIKCIKSTFNISVDTVGIWNEQLYTNKYIKILRSYLDNNNENNTKIVASDNRWEIANDIKADKELAASIFAIGAHYPGTESTDTAKALNINLWASEDYSTFNDDIGAGCWARILNQNYVKGYITSTIAWNAVASYFDGFPFPRCSLMTANEPWSGHFTLNGPIWITAHTTQFVEPGWRYLNHGEGVGFLPKGGSYVTLSSPGLDHFTIVIETMTRDHSKCIRPFLPKFTVEPQNVTLTLGGENMQKIQYFHVWATQLRFDKGQKSDYFVYLGKKEVVSNRLNLSLGLDQVITLSTLNGQHPEDPPIAPTKDLPLPYRDDFQPKPPSYITEPEYLTPQIGYFELVPSQISGANFVLQQMVLERPVDWCSISRSPITLMGDSSKWVNMHVAVSGRLPSTEGASSLFIAGRVNEGGCWVTSANGIFGWLDFARQQYEITTDMLRRSVVMSGPIELRKDQWYNLELVMYDGNTAFYVDRNRIASVSNVSVRNPGFVGFGSGEFGYSYYANFSVDYACAWKD